MKKKLHFLFSMVALMLVATFAHAQEDYTAKVGTAKTDWGGSGTYGNVTTFAGTSTPMAEFYGSSDAGTKLSQKVTGLDEGVYEVTVFAASHNAWNNNGATLQADANDVAYIFATANEVTLKEFFTARRDPGFNGNEPYKVTISNINVIDGELTLGLGLAKGGQTEWQTIQIYQLTRTGDLSLEGFVNAYNDALTAAKNTLNAGGKIGSSELTTLSNAVKTYDTGNVDETSPTELSKATAALLDANDAATSSASLFASAKTKLDAMKELADATNVYTSAAYASYYSQWAEKYEEGTLTTEEAQNLQDPSLVTGWHASITVDNFLLSAWDTKPDFPEGVPYYINTWSVEGDNDGTNFRVPFFEYFTADANSLGAKTLTATMEGLIPGQYYKATAWVRNQPKKDVAAADITGITLQVNDGTPVDVTEGEVKGGFNIGEFSAKGVVGEDGKLLIKFIVADESNSHWLSFKNVKFEAAEPDYGITIDNEITNGSVKANIAEAEAGTKVVLTITPAEGYQLETLSVKAGEETIEVAEDNTFVMPAAAVTISATFAEIPAPQYAITISDGIENGTVEADVAEAKAGETVTLTITPAANYELESLSVKAGEEDVEVAEGYTFLMPAAAVTVSASFKAKEPVIAPGKYYIQNVSTGLYWGAGNDWGTQASLLAHPDYVTLVSNEDGTYKIESLVDNKGKYFFDGEWMDGVAKPVTITKAGDYYTFSNGTTFYGANPEGKATTFEGTMILGTPAGDSQEALWKVISEEEMAATLATATESNPVDATYLIADHTFGRNHRLVNAWTNEGGAALTGGNSDKHDAEKYHGTFNVYQKLAGAPAGVYKFSAQGFYRQDGSDNDNLPVFYANEETSTFPLKTGTENSMKDACTSFEAGKYLIEPIYVQVTEAGELTVGAKLVTNGNLWCIWDNFVLTYYGPDADIATIKLGGLIADVAALREKATELKDNSSVTATTVGKLETALANSEDIEKTEEAYKAAINELKSATERANYEVESKTAIDAMYALMENTNVYTTDAYNTYKGIADGLLEKYNDGTLTETVVNPSAIAGWHSANNYDDLLLSAWSIGGNKCKDFNTSLYINTWSVEGENDGSEFKVPFFEYWIDDTKSLGANTLTGTVEGLDPGFYSVSAWVRVRAKNGYTAPAYGITMDANEGKAVDVAAGAQIGESQFFLDEFKTIGEVGADGVLKINIKIDADNNISWLSFKNVKFEQIPVEDPASCIVNAELNPEANPKGWTENVSGGFRDFGMGKIGTYNVRFSPATVDETHLETEFCAGFEARWEGNFASYQQTTGTLAPGYYELTYDVENVNGGTTKANYNNLFTVTVGDKVYTDKRTEWMTGKSGWTKHSILFQVEELSPITVSLGYGTGSNNFHADNTPALYVSHLEMSESSLEKAKADANAEIAALAPIGDGIFMYTQDNIDAAKIAVEAATTLEEVLTAIPTLNYPEADKAYVIANTTADGNLSITTNKVSVAKGAKVFFTAVEGGYVLSNEAGEYIFKKTNDTWTLSTTEEAANAYAVNFNVVEGGYTIQGANGLFGLDNATEGSAVYANKAAANNGIWTIAEFIPTYEIAIKDGIENGSVEADATEAAAGATVKLTITPAEGYELKSISISYGEDEDAKTIKPDEENSFIMPAAPVVIDAVFSVIIPDIVLSAPTFNMESGTQNEPSLYPAGTALKVTYTAENLEANGLTADDVQVKISVMLSGDLPENSMNMQSETKHSIMPPQTFYIPLGETDFPEALKNGYVYQSINIMSAELVKPETETEPEEILAAYVGGFVSLRWVGLEAEEEEIDPNLIEIAQETDQEPVDDITIATKTEGEKYTQYTFAGGVSVAVKILDVDVKNCDYVIVKFAEPVPAGIKASFVNGIGFQDIPEGATEVKCVIADNTDVQNGVMPQISLLTIYDGNGKSIKVKGIYKHLDEEGQVQINDIDAAKAKRNGKFYKKGQFFILNGGRAFSLNGIETK